MRDGGLTSALDDQGMALPTPGDISILLTHPALEVLMMDRLTLCNYCVLPLFSNGESVFPGCSKSFQKLIAVQYDISLCLCLCLVFLLSNGVEASLPKWV